MTHPQDFTSEVSTSKPSAGHSYTTLSGCIDVHCEHDDFDYYLHMRPGHTPAEVRLATKQMRAWGLKPIAEDAYYQIEERDNGDVRMHFDFIVPVMFDDPLALSWA